MPLASVPVGIPSQPVAPQLAVPLAQLLVGSAADVCATNHDAPQLITRVTLPLAPVLGIVPPSLVGPQPVLSPALRLVDTAAGVFASSLTTLVGPQSALPLALRPDGCATGVCALDQVAPQPAAQKNSPPVSLPADCSSLRQSFAGTLEAFRAC